MAMRFVESPVFRTVVDTVADVMQQDNDNSVNFTRSLFQQWVTEVQGGNWLECESVVSTAGLAVFKVSGWNEQHDGTPVFVVFAVMGDGEQEVMVVDERPTFVPE